MNHRRTWSDFPTSLRSRLEAILGGPVAHTRSCSGGFSPSSAEIVTSTTGHSLFVKAVRELDNPDSVRLNRREVDTLAALPASAPAPSLVASFTEQDWFVLVTEVAPGALPTSPWTPVQIDQVLEALDSLQASTTPCPVPGLPTVQESLGPDMLGFDRVAADPPADLDPWIAARLEQLQESSRRGINALDGDTLCHADMRADNMLIAPDGTVRFVDWAWASRGSRTADALQLLLSIDDRHGHLGINTRIDAVLGAHGLPRQVGTDVLAGVLGFFVDAARWPVSPSLPKLSEHRRAQRDSILALIRHR